MWDIYRQPLPNWRYRLLPTDTRSLISAVFLGLGMTVALQIAERIDFAYSGGSLFLVAVLLVPQFENPAAMFYGLTGALIVAWINPVVANLTATSPLSFLFFSWSTRLIAQILEPGEQGLVRVEGVEVDLDVVLLAEPVEERLRDVVEPVVEVELARGPGGSCGAGRQAITVQRPA